jgi:transcriptional antiterminator RfaH
VLIISQWWNARWSPGVVRIVLAGNVPARVDDKIIAELHARERGGVVQLPEAPGMKVGDRVRVLGGPFAGHLGLYAGMKPRERIEVLLQLLGGACRVTLARSDVAALG